MKQTLLLLTLIGTLTLTGCGAFNNETFLRASAFKNDRDRTYSEGNYLVSVWSGGEAVRTYDVKSGYVHKEANSDGYFFMHNGKLVRVSGTITIEQQ